MAKIRRETKMEILKMSKNMNHRATGKQHEMSTSRISDVLLMSENVLERLNYGRLQILRHEIIQDNTNMRTKQGSKRISESILINKRWMNTTYLIRWQEIKLSASFNINASVSPTCTFTATVTTRYFR